MFVKAKKQQVITSVFIFLWILIVNLITPLITEIPAWPMFFVSIFFFVMGEDMKNIKPIFGGGITGIILMYVLSVVLLKMQPVLGEAMTMFILLTLILFLIIVGGNFVPTLFNNITFAFLTIGTINLDPVLIHDSCGGWLGMLVIGGIVILGGIFGIVGIVNKVMVKKVW